METKLEEILTSQDLILGRLIATDFQIRTNSFYGFLDTELETWVGYRCQFISPDRKRFIFIIEMNLDVDVKKHFEISADELKMKIRTQRVSFVHHNLRLV